jgi:uncharacterized protein YjbI with pentapeptide repeats
MSESRIPQEKRTIRDALRPPRTLWDWLRLLLLPCILIAGIVWINAQINQAFLQQRETALAIADQQRQAAILNSYMDKISDLLLHEDLLHANNLSAARLVAQVSTITALQELHPDKKAALMSFLLQTRLINNDYHIISLVQADLSGADLRNIDLRDTNLSGANLSGANLSGANLSYATLQFVNLSNATLHGANLQAADFDHANLKRANLSRAYLLDALNLSSDQIASVRTLAGATMPDGSLHR